MADLTGAMVLNDSEQWCHSMFSTPLLVDKHISLRDGFVPPRFHAWCNQNH
jgi:hypothetical protein